MEGTIQIHIEKLPEGYCLATCDEVQRLVAQGITLTETLEIARDVIKKLFESQAEDRTQPKKLGFGFYRHAARGHEIWYNSSTRKYTPIPNHSGDMPESI